MYLDPRLLAFTRGVRLRITAAVGLGLLQVVAGIARLALLGWLLARVIGGAGAADLVWPILGVGAVISGDFFGWNFGLAYGFGGLLVATVVVTIMYFGLCYSIAEMSPALPHTGGAYSFARSAMGPWGGFLTGLAENMEYVITPAVVVGAIGLLMQSLVVEMFNVTGDPWWNSEPFWWAIFYVIFVGINVIGIEATFRFTVIITVLALTSSVFSLVMAGPLIARAQQAGKVYRIGILETIPATRNAANLDALRKEARSILRLRPEDVVFLLEVQVGEFVALERLTRQVDDVGRQGVGAERIFDRLDDRARRPKGHRRNPLTSTPTGGRILSAMQVPWFTVLPPRGFGVLTTIGRRSGRRRRTCVRVVRVEDTAYLTAIRGPRSGWLRNLRANRTVWLRIRGGTFAGIARVGPIHSQATG